MKFRELRSFLNKHRSPFHDFSLGILIGYHRLFELGNVVFIDDNVVRITKNTIRCFNFNENFVDINEFNKKKITIFMHSDIGEISKYEKKKIENITNDVGMCLDRFSYSNKKKRRILSGYENFLRKNRDYLLTEEITKKNIHVVKEIYERWIDFKTKNKGLSTRMFPSYYLATERCIKQNVKLFKKVFYYDGVPFAYRVDDIEFGDMAFLISFSSLFFDRSFPSNLSNYVTLMSYSMMKDSGVKVVNTGRPTTTSLRRFKESFAGTKIIEHFVYKKKNEDEPNTSLDRWLT